MTTRRSFLKGAAAGAAALVAGVKLGWPREAVEEVVELVEEEPYVPDAIEQVVAEAHAAYAPTKRLHGKACNGGIEIDGRRFDGNYSLTFTRTQDAWIPDYYFPPKSGLTGGLMYAELDLQLIMDQGVELFEPYQILPVRLQPGYRMEGNVDSVGYQAAGDYWLVDLQMTCYNVVYEGPDRRI